MSTLRRTWLALMGAILLITLSVSAAFGAKPADSDEPRGQSIAAFVHELVFGSDETDEEVSQDEDEDEDGTDEDEDVVEDDEEELVDDSERQVPEEFANHGECVADAAHDTDGFEESDAENFGAWVSMHARYVCWGLEPPTDETDEDAVEEEDEDSESEDAMTKAERKAAREAAREERKAARAEAKAERVAAHAAAKAERFAAKAERFAAKAAAKAARGH